MSRIYVFNQYYLDLLKKTRNAAKKYQDKSIIAKSIIKAIKKYYQVFDKTTSENIEMFNENFTQEILTMIMNHSNEEFSEWIKNNPDIPLYRDISVSNASKVIKDDMLIHHYLLILAIFTDETLTDENIKNIIERFKGLDETIPIPEKYEKTIHRIIQMNMKKTAGFNMDELQDTSIGKLAKDIIEDLNLDKIKDSVKNEEDILKALGNSENGLGNLLSNVTQKMATKLSSGEIQQDALFKDALNFAKKMPQFQGAKGGGGGMPDLDQMMKMMNGMMGGGGNKMGGMKKKLKKKMAQH